MTTSAASPHTTTRYFGKCYTATCKYRNVRDINFRNLQDAREINNGRCPECNNLMKYTRLEGKYNPAKECGSRCMASIGPSCSCSCGGENHGNNHV